MHLTIRTLLLTLICLSGNAMYAQPTEIFAERLIYLNKPIEVLSATEDPNDDRLYIVGHEGIVWIYEDGDTLAEPFLDLAENGLDILNYGNSSEQGVNGMIFDPDYEENGFFYITYTGVRPDGTGQAIEQRLMCFKRDENNPNKADTSQWYELLEFDEGTDPQTGHNGGKLAYGPDGYLYVSCGDGGSTGSGQPGGGSGGDDHGAIGNGQSLQTFLGKILRIEPHGMDPYTIPADNPYVDDPDALDEIWAYGLRNPWRFSFDSETGDMYIGDVGEVDWEEISFQEADSPGGLNYGWRLMEGNNCYEPVVDCDPDGLTVPPIFDYPHDNGWCSVIGGVVYHGTDVPSLEGYYIFSDACGFEEVRFWTLYRDGGGNWISNPIDIIVDPDFILFQEGSFSFSEDNEGEVYLNTTIAVYKFSFDPNNIKEFGEESFKLFPNPAGNSVNLCLSQRADAIEVIDSSGRWVYNEIPGERFNIEIPLEGLNAGIYFVRIYSQEGVSTKRFVKQF